MEGGLIQAASALNSVGDAGAIVVTVGSATLTAGAQIDSSTRGAGRGGTVTVTATEALTIAGHDRENFPSGLFSSTRGAGAAGAVVVHAGQLTLREGGKIASDTSGAGRGGDLRLQARTMQLTEGAMISTESTGTAGDIRVQEADRLLFSGHSTVTTGATQADGGNIALTAQTLVRLRDSQIITAVGSGEGRGGNISIDPEFLILENSQLTANAFGGPGGNITIRAGVFLADPGSRVTASSARNVPGEINIQAPITALSGLVAPLPQTFGAAGALLRDQCAARLREGTVSSLVERGRDGVPATPDGVLPGRLSPAVSADAGRLLRKTRVASHGVRQPDPTGPSQGGSGSARAVSARPPPLDCAR